MHFGGMTLCHGSQAEQGNMPGREQSMSQVANTSSIHRVGAYSGAETLLFEVAVVVSQRLDTIR